MLLQLYIASQQNRFDALLCFSIVTSSISISLGVVGALKITWKKLGQKMNKVFQPGFLIMFSIVSTLILTFLTNIPSLAFFCSMKSHGSPSYIAFVLVFYCVIATYLCVPNPVIQLVMTVVCAFVTFWFATAWIVSISPFLPGTSSIPSQIWPNTSGAMRAWLINDTDSFNETWVVCNISSNRIDLSSVSRNASFDTMFDLVANHNATLFDLAREYQFCLTDIAAPLYYIILTLIGWQIMFNLSIVMYFGCDYEKD